MLLKEPVVHCWVNTGRNDQWCTCFCSEGTGAQLTLPLEELSALPGHRDYLEGDSHLSVPDMSVGNPPWPPWDPLRGRPASRLSWTRCPWSLIASNPKQQQPPVFRFGVPVTSQPNDASALTTALVRSLLTAPELWGPADRCSVWELGPFLLILNTEQFFHVTSLWVRGKVSGSIPDWQGEN